MRIAAEFEGSRRDRFKQLAEFASIGDRRCADWMSCNGSDAADTDAISQLQTSRRDYHTIAIRGLLCQTNNEHLRRTLFEPWEYADPIAGLSLHLEPREDRRHAYQWHTPSGDPTRKSSGGMIGANRLSLEAWPLFQSLPTSDPVKLKTTGFLGTRVSDTRLTWPIWTCPVTIELLQSLLNFGELQTTEVESQKLLPLSIERIYRCQKILVGKTPNLTPAVAVLA